MTTNDLLNRPEKEVINELKRKNARYRIVGRDGESFVITMDYNPGRYNLYITDGIVTRVRMG